MHPNGASIQSSDLPIIISPYGNPDKSPTAAPSITIFMDMAASSSSAMTWIYRLDPSIIPFSQQIH